MIWAGGGAVLGGVSYWLIKPDEADASATQLSVADAHQQAGAGQIVLVDIRRPDEWQRTGIAVPAHPVDMRRPDFAAAIMDLVDNDPHRPVALICARGVRSSRMARTLRDAGFTRVIDVPEGMIGSSAGPGWVAAGLPLKSHEVQN